MAAASLIDSAAHTGKGYPLLRIRTPMLVMNEKEEYVSPIAMYAKKGVASLRDILQEKFALLSFCNLVSTTSLATATWHDPTPFVGSVFLASTLMLGSTLYWTIYPPVESFEKVMGRFYKKDEDEYHDDSEDSHEEGVAIGMSV